MPKRELVFILLTVALAVLFAGCPFLDIPLVPGI